MPELRRQIVRLRQILFVFMMAQVDKKFMFSEAEMRSPMDMICWVEHLIPGVSTIAGRPSPPPTAAARQDL